MAAVTPKGAAAGVAGDGEHVEPVRAVEVDVLRRTRLAVLHVVWEWSSQSSGDRVRDIGFSIARVYSVASIEVVTDRGRGGGNQSCRRHIGHSAGILRAQIPYPHEPQRRSWSG